MDARKKRGGQVGNTNALKHGFYADVFNETELEEIAYIREGLQDEISLLRVALKRLLKYAEQFGGEETNFEGMKDTLELMGSTTISIGHLMKIQKFLGGDEDENVENAISQALHDIMKEWKC